jgi:hypothetical protein
MGRGSSIMYGKIQLASEGESVEKLVGQLDVILKRFGYPEKKAEEAEEKDKEESKAIDEAINKAKPARDSVIDLVKKENELIPEVGEEDEDVDDFHPDDEP